MRWHMDTYNGLMPKGTKSIQNSSSFLSVDVEVCEAYSKCFKLCKKM